MRLIINANALNPDPGGRVQQYIDAQVIKECEPYVPFREGILKGSARVANGGGAVEYTAPYARRHYYNAGGVDILGRRYGPSTFKGGPLRGSFWFERMKKAGGAERILRGAAALVGARASR